MLVDLKESAERGKPFRIRKGFAVRSAGIRRSSWFPRVKKIRRLRAGPLLGKQDRGSQSRPHDQSDEEQEGRYRHQPHRRSDYVERSLDHSAESKVRSSTDSASSQSLGTCRVQATPTPTHAVSSGARFPSAAMRQWGVFPLGRD